MAYDQTHNETYQLLGGINSKVSPYEQQNTEFRDLTNVNFQVPGSLSKRMGSTLYLGATVQGRITGLYEFNRLNGASYLIATANTNAYNVTSSYSAFKTGLQNGAIFDFITFVDRLFACNGNDFFTYDGSNTYSFGLPSGITGSWGVTATAGGSLTAGVTGVFVCSYGYVNETGSFGANSNGITITVNGVSYNAITYYGLTAPTGYGVTALAMYRTSNGGIDQFFTTYSALGSTTFTDTGFPLTSRLENDSLFFTLAPKYMEIYNNQLFMAGFSSMLSTVYWSEIGEPQNIDPTFFAEFRTNDGDRITGLKTYAGSLVVTKRKSFHRLTGDNPDNFTIQEISDQYGCLSNRTLIQWENFLWFLDEKGIIQYNGANIDVISAKIQPIFDTMNIDAAIDNAVGVYDRQRNELWFSVPCNGATYNNCTVVFDTIVKAWTKYEGFNPSALAYPRGRLEKNVPFYGGYTGNIFNFGASYLGDNGNSITCLIKTHFLAARQQTNESQYRRFYLDVDPIVGFTQAISVDFMSNYGSSVVASRTMYQNPFQSRVDFGIPARSIQASIYHNSATIALKVNGFAFTSRFQRDK